MANIDPYLEEEEGLEVEFDSLGDEELFEMGMGDTDLVPIEAEMEILTVEEQDPFAENLAEVLSENYLNALGREIVRLVDQDIEDRAPWEQRYKDGMKMAGLYTRENMDDGPFPGAADVCSTIVSEALTHFWSTALGEIFPAQGPIKVKPYGKPTEAEADRGKRVEEHMNFQLMHEDKGYYDESSRLIFATGFQGSAFRKTYFDGTRGYTVGEHVYAENFIVPWFTKTLERGRHTHRQYKSPNEVKWLQVVGHYRMCELRDPQEDDDSTIMEIKDDLNDTVRGDESLDQRHEIYECYIELEIEGDEHTDEDGNITGVKLPYIVSVDKNSAKVLSIYRNWREGDELYNRRVYFTKYDYLPNHGGFYGLGVFHILGELQTASTGALRAILDAAATSSLQGGFKSSDSGIKADRLIIEPGVYKDVDATFEDLQKAFWSPNFKEPSPALFNALVFLTDTGRRLASITDVAVGDADNKAPVGTTIALIENSKKVYTAIHKGLHRSAGEEFRQRFELNREFIPMEGYPYDVDGDPREIYQMDYGPGLSIVPVSDPNIFSSTQRVAIYQAVYQLYKENPQLFDGPKVLSRVLQGLNVPDWEELLVGEERPPPMDPLSELQSLMMNKPIQAYPEQDQKAHIDFFFNFMMNPQFGGHPQVAQIVMPTVQAILAQRLAYLYAQHYQSQGVPVNYIDPKTGESMGPSEVPFEQITQAISQVNPKMTNLPGLPMPPDPKQQEQEQKMKQAQAEGQQKLQQKDAEFKQSMAHKQQEFETKVNFDIAGEQQKQAFKVEDHIAKMHMNAESHNQKMDQAIQDATLTNEEKMHDFVMEQAKADLEIALKKYEATIAALEKRDELKASRAEKELEIWFDKRKKAQELEAQKAMNKVKKSQPASNGDAR